MKRYTAWVILLGLALAAAAQAQPAPVRSTVREYKKKILTYPFSDPDPIPTAGRIYPYYRFDGYTHRAVEKEWTVVELENRYLKVTVLPEIGGKVWSAVEKRTGRSFIYDNRVVKFRDIAMRGPWTSGGMEPNYGIIGHTPNCATPVDYLTRLEQDGSATVVIGVLDLLTRTPWRLEVSLPADKAYFTTRSFWYNATPLEQPYYTWMNVGLKAAGNLQLIYPGTHHLGHGGEAAPWPVHPENGKDLSFYEQNDFGPYKSYHVVGRHSDFFGAYWHDDDFGMGRYATRDDKLGKKAWIWGLSRQGMIWEQLLTDSDGQYVEVQSGRLFNQAAEDSTFTPFKHRGFAPYSTDTWTEFWFPVKGTKGFVKANQVTALNARVDGGRLQLRLSPLQRVADTLEVLDGERVVFSEQLALAPLQAWSRSIPWSAPPGRVRVRIGEVFQYEAGDGDVLARPLEGPKDFDWGSVYGLYLQGKEWIRQREYARAQASLEACLRKDPHYLPALADLAMLRYRALDARGAWEAARHALSIDTYDPAANYYYALAAQRLNRIADAKDGFEVASASPEFRSAAWTELAKLYLAEGNLDRANDYASRSLDTNRLNLDGHHIQAIVARLRGQAVRAERALTQALAIDPLDHLARFERYLLTRGAARQRSFESAIRNEQPHETFLELAAWYRRAGRLRDASRALEIAPPTAEVLYWLAFLQSQLDDPAAAATLQRAGAASPELVFPFRLESADVLEWAVERAEGWRPRYYLALLKWGLGDAAAARRLLDACGDTPDYAPFYAARAKVNEGVSRDKALDDLQRAARLDPKGWRYGRLLVQRLIADQDFAAALQTAERYHQADPANYITGMLHAKTLLLNRRFGEADAALRALRVLPYEGATEGRTLYREAQLMLAVEHMRATRGGDALKRVAAAREWPEHLGAGKPYPEEVDERLEDWLEAMALDAPDNRAASRAPLERLAAASSRPGQGRLLSALALARLERPEQARQALQAWASAVEPPIAAWGRALLAGERPALPTGASAPVELRVIHALLR